MNYGLKESNLDDDKNDLKNITKEEKSVKRKHGSKVIPFIGKDPRKKDIFSPGDNLS